MNHIELGIKIDEKLEEAELDITKLEEEYKKLQEEYETERKKLADKLNYMHNAKDKLIEERKKVKRLEDIEKKRQENLKKWKKEEAKLKEQEAKLTEEIMKASDEFLQDEPNYEVYEESFTIDFTIDADNNVTLDANADLDADATLDADAALDDVQYVCSITIEENIHEAINQSSKFLEGIKNKCEVLNRLWKYVQTQLTGLANLQENSRRDAIFIIARNPDNEIVGIEFGKMIINDGHRISAQSLFTIVDPIYRGQKYGRSIVLLYEDAVRKKVAERANVGAEGKTVTAFVTVYDSNNFWSSQGYCCLPGEKINSKVLLAKKLPVKYEKEIVSRSTSSYSAELGNSNGINDGSAKFDPEALLRPSESEIDKLVKNPVLLREKLTACGWYFQQIFTSFDAFIPPYKAHKINDFLTRTLGESLALRENEDYFKPESTEAIKQHLLRYGFGVKYRPMTSGELRKLLEINGWKWINKPLSKKWACCTETVWIRCGVDKNTIEVPDGLNVDYFEHIEHIVDYFESVKRENKLRSKNEWVKILPVVIERNDPAYMSQKQKSSGPSPPRRAALSDITNKKRSSSGNSENDRSEKKSKLVESSDENFNKGKRNSSTTEIIAQQQNSKVPLEYFSDAK
jgi:hypothetical protein